MEQYKISGMSCSACSARVEKAVSKVEGVSSCSVSLLTNSLGVEGNAKPDSIIKAVEAAGYGVVRKQSKAHSISQTASYDAVLEDKETPRLRKRLLISICFLIPLMYVSMGHMMWNWPLPAFLQNNHIAMGLVQLLFTSAIIVINQRFFISGFRALIKKAPNMDTLVALGAAASFLYSLYALFVMTIEQEQGHQIAVEALMHEFYFESAAMILTLITLGKMLEAKSKGRTTDALKSLIKLAPKTAVIVKDGKEVEIEAEQVRVGDTFVIRPGESIPVDGVIMEGSSAVNEAALTGESIPIDKSVGDTVSAATINHSGFLVCRATRVGEDTSLSQIIQMVSDAAATKAPIAKVADRVSGIFVPVVMGIAAVTLIIWLLTGQTVGYALARAISVLVISCPCALGLATPVAIMVGNGVAARHGIMFKTALSLEETGKTRLVILDKTGTITKGEPRVTEIYPVEGVTEDELLQLAYSLEIKSEHPLAGAIVKTGNEKGIKPLNIKDFQAETGNGVSGIIENKYAAGGKPDFIKDKVVISSEIEAVYDKMSKKGMTPLLFSIDKKLKGIITVADTIKEDSASAVNELQNMGIRVFMLTGDNEMTAHAIGQQVGVDEVIAGVLPDGKAEIVEKFKNQGKTIMVGDGINDAPALTIADMGIAIGAGTDVAIEAADVVLVKSRLSDVPAAIRMSKATLRNIHENLFWAFIYNIIGIPLAAGLFIPIFGWTLNPMFAAAAMSLSSFCVVTNSLRLNLYKINKTEKQEEQEERKGVKEMTITIKGMMCKHCEAHIKSALEAIDGVKTATADHIKGTAVVELDGQVSEDKLRKAVEEAGYETVGFI